MNIMLYFILFYMNIIYSYEYFGQFFQDKFIANFYNYKKNGVFVDIGAHDGVFHSNSYFFEKYLNWTGICIEAMPSVFDELLKKRKCICRNVCLSNDNGFETFILIHNGKGYIDGLSGIKKFMSQDHLASIKNIAKNANLLIDEIIIKTISINDVLQESNIYNIDYFSIDIEGGELEILKNLNFDKFNIKIIDVENNYASKELRDFIISKGFKLLKRLGVDDIFINERFTDL
jgi:FkbM family methyltransferase